MENKIQMIKKTKKSRDKSKGVTIPPIEYYKKNIKKPSQNKTINLTKKKIFIR